MNFKGTSLLVFILLLIFIQTALSENRSPVLKISDETSSLRLKTILDRVEHRYLAAGFSAMFLQESSLKAMDITDTATGKLYFKHPGKMRWEYEKPDRQTIISDNKKLWVYRPDDNQVMIGKAPSFFGDGKGAGFLSDMKTIRENFDIFLEHENKNDQYHLTLTPIKKTQEISAIDLSISKTTYHITRIVTYNAYGDATLIELTDIRKIENMDNTLFSFEIPEGSDIIRLGE